MKKAIRAKYTLEFKQEAVRMAEAKGSIVEVSRELGLPEQTLFNWVKTAREGLLLDKTERIKALVVRRWSTRFRWWLQVVPCRPFITLQHQQPALGNAMSAPQKTRPAGRVVFGASALRR